MNFASRLLCGTCSVVLFSVINIDLGLAGRGTYATIDPSVSNVNPPTSGGNNLSLKEKKKLPAEPEKANAGPVIEVKPIADDELRKLQEEKRKLKEGRRGLQEEKRRLKEEKQRKNGRGECRERERKKEKN